MGLMENLRLSLEGLRANKMRAVLTMLGIIIGIAAVIAILTVGDGLSSSITGTLSDMGASSITISLQERDNDNAMAMMSAMMGGYGSSTIDEKDLISEEMISKLRQKFSDEITSVSLTESAGSGQVKDGRLYANVSVTGVNADYFEANDLDILKGRLLKERDDQDSRMVCLASDKLVNNMFDGDVDAALGSKVSAEISGKRYQFQIVGVYKYEANVMTMSTSSEKDMSTTFYIPLSSAKKIADAKDGFSSLTVQAAPGLDGAALAEDIEDFLNKYYQRNDDYSVTATSMESMIESMNEVMSTVSIAISVIAAISLLVGGIGVMNIMLVSVTERTREIGTRKALGATNDNIRMQFVVESVMICLVGGFIGIILGTVLGYVGSLLLGMVALPSLSSIALAVGFSLAVGVFFGYYPANKAAQMNPIEALRYE